MRLGTIEQALAELKLGRPVLVADSPDRENEADVILAASSATSEWVAWTIRHSSGYLCAPMPGERADALELPLMVPHSQDPRRTAYTVTVDATTGITTGISAADRTRTLRVLADPASGPVDLIRPGHVLPLRAVAGGVLHRAGHTEAAVDLVRLADVGEVGAIAELVNDDGSMMRLGDASALAERESLVLITIEDLIEWRKEHDPIGVIDHVPTDVLKLVEPVSTAKLPTAYGDFTIHGFRDVRSGAEHIALVPAGSVPNPQQVPTVRVHSECLTGDAFGSLRCDCGPQLQTAMRLVAERGGAVIYQRGHEGRGIGLLAKIGAYHLQDEGRDTVQANIDLGWPADRRDYGAAAGILTRLGLTRINLLTNNPAKVTGLRASGITIEETIGIEVGHTAQNHEYLMTKKVHMGHMLDLVQVTPPVAPPTSPAVAASSTPAKESNR